MKRFALSLCLAIFAAAACAKGGPYVELKGHRYSIEFAENESSREYGLMNRTEMADDHGMLFVFDNDEPRAFWMKNTKIPLDMIFIDKNRKVVSIKHDAPPCVTERCPAFMSEGPVRYVLELNGGQAAKLGLSAGDELIVQR
jgi:uncharacterized membrane protein (UPF0127 family)